MISAALLLAMTNVLQSLLKDVDGRIAKPDPQAASCRFVRYPTGGDTVELNPRFWGRSLDLSCASPWNSGGGRTRAGTLISRRHIVFAKHFSLWKGVRIVFVDNEGNVCPCHIEATKAIDNTDIMIGLLNAEVTPSVHPAKLLPDDYENHIGNGVGLPVVTLNQNEKLILAELSLLPGADDPRKTVCSYSYKQPHRRVFWEPLVGGDSGNPAFLLVGDQLILLYCLSGGGGGSGPALHLYKREIQKAMDELCPGYRLKCFDFGKSAAGVTKVRGVH